MRTNQTAQTRNDVVRQLRRMLLCHEQNHRLLVCEIHDSVIQDATAAQMHLQTLIEKDMVAPGPARDEIQRAAALIGRAIEEARQLVSGMQPSVLGQQGLVPALEALIADQPLGGPTIRLVPKMRRERLDPLLETAIYRMVQEGIANARRHSRSDRVEIRLIEEDDHLRAEIRDWGTGFDPAAVPEDRHGLRGLRQRVGVLRGHVAITSHPGEGTRIQVELPLVPKWETCRGTGTDMNDRSYE